MILYTTLQVVRALELHPDWVFEAPETDELFHSRAYRDKGNYVFEHNINEQWHDLLNDRSDWRLASPKREKRRKVKIGVRDSGAMNPRWNWGAIDRLDDTKSWTLYAVERREK